MTSSGQRNERNKLIWHQGLVRKDLLHVGIDNSTLQCSPLGNNMCNLHLASSSWNCEQVTEWISSIGMGQYSQLFRDNQIDGGRLLTTDAASILLMGVENTKHALRMESCIRELNRSKRHDVGQIDILPHMYYHALNLGQSPPQQHYGELLYPYSTRSTIHQQ